MIPLRLVANVGWTDRVAPSVATSVVDGVTIRLVGPRVVADVVVAGDGPPGRREAVELPAGVVEGLGVVGAVEGQIPGVDHQIRRVVLQMAEHRLPVRLRLRRGPREVGVGHDRQLQGRHRGHATGRNSLAERGIGTLVRDRCTAVSG
jgi:hypothetical protein